ncbi:class III signal peptide-containing protein [Candidatus Micrarchaeota archaeon]|nr:class III signal peptide-containing protein [Candidatus Micrarchaeota archaeon]
MKGQLSAEMLILLAVLIAIVALAAYYMIEMGKESGEKIEEKSDEIMEKIDEIENPAFILLSGKCESPIKC